MPFKFQKYISTDAACGPQHMRVYGHTQTGRLPVNLIRSLKLKLPCYLTFFFDANAQVLAFVPSKQSEGGVRVGPGGCVGLKKLFRHFNIDPRPTKESCLVEWDETEKKYIVHYPGKQKKAGKT